MAWTNCVCVILPFLFKILAIFNKLCFFVFFFKTFLHNMLKTFLFILFIFNLLYTQQVTSWPSSLYMWPYFIFLPPYGLRSEYFVLYSFFCSLRELQGEEELGNSPIPGVSGERLTRMSQYSQKDLPEKDWAKKNKLTRI